MKASGGMPGMEDIQRMMQDPNVMAKAKQMAAMMGQDPNMLAKAQQMAAGMGGMGGMGGAEAEIARLRAENAALKGMA